MNTLGRESLDENWTICPVGGIDKISSFASLFAGNKLNIAILVDYQYGQKGKVRRLKESEILKKCQVYSADMYVENDEADIEDIIGAENYITLVNNCYGLNKENLLKFEEYSSNERVVKFVEEHMCQVKQNVLNFNHYEPSLYLTRNSDEIMDKLPELEDSLERFEKIFKDLNALIAKKD